MSGIPYNKLMTVSTPVCDADGNQVAEVSTNFAFVIPCRECKHYRKSVWCGITDITDACLFFADGVKVEPDGFCAWGEAERPQRDATCGR